METLEIVDNVYTVGHVGLGYAGPKIGTVKQEVHDGDTIGVRAIGNFGVRLLGVDAPEISFPIGARLQDFIYLKNERWVKHLEDPFAQDPMYKQQFSEGLLKHLEERFGPDTALNHYRHAEKAHRALEEIIENDRKALGQSIGDFRFIIVFAFEVMDRYGRMLGLIDSYIENEQIRKDRPFYNLRLMKMGLVNPYSIWPNLDPFRKVSKITDALFGPKDRDKWLKSEIGDIMKWAREAREKKIGIFDEDDPLLLEPFEVRYLGRKELPSRWVIDLSKDDNMLLKPEEYYKVDRENRLFINDEYVPFFEKRGWVAKK